MADEMFVTAINCMDGRVQDPVLQWMKDRFGADHVDMITEPGPDRIMRDGPAESITSIKDRVDISVEKHGSGVVAIAAHDDCAGFPVTKAEHLQALDRCIDVIKSWRHPVRILALWIDENWEVNVVHDSDG